MALNKVMLIGNVGKDVEVRYLDQQTKVARFSVALTERFKDRDGNVKESTEWVRVVAWRNNADYAEKYLEKGKQLYVEGKMKSRSYQDQSGAQKEVVEVVAERMMLLGRKSEGDGAQAQRAGQQTAVGAGARPMPSQPQTAAVSNGGPEDDLPF